MRTLRFPLAAGAIIPALTILVVLCSAGCSSDSSTKSDDDGDGHGLYLITAYVGNALVPGGSISANVNRLDAADASAKECVITVNGTTVPLLPLASTDSNAVFTRLNFGYQAGTTYTVVATIAGRSATCSFVAPPYVWPTIDSPADGSGYETGQPIALSWSFEGDAPDQVQVEASGDGDDILYEQALPGSTLSHTIPGSATANWTDDDLLVTVDFGERVWPFTGELAAPGSVAGTVLPGDAIILNHDDTPEDAYWTVTVQAESASLAADGASTTRIDVVVQDQTGGAPPDGTPVVFSVEPAGMATVDPVSATILGGTTYTTIQAGLQSGTVEVIAAALGETGMASLSLTATLQVTVGTGSYPLISWSPPDPMLGLVVRQDGVQIGNLRWSLVPSGISGFGSPVVYGTTPAGAQQIYPFTGAPQGLTIGASHRLGLVDALGDTTFVTFTP